MEAVLLISISDALHSTKKPSIILQDFYSDSSSQVSQGKDDSVSFRIRSTFWEMKKIICNPI